MAVVLDKKDVDKFISLASKENLEATAVAVVTESPRLTMNWRGDTIVDLSREFLNTNGVTQVAKAYIEAPKWEGCYRKVAPAKLKDMPADEAFLENMSRLEVCSQIGLAERFDASIGAATVIMPFGGKNQLTPQEAMAAKIPLEKGETDDATAMSYGYIPGVSRWSPFHGSAYAVVESLSKLLAIGANPMTARLTFQEYFERLKDVPSRWGKPAAALLGAMQAQLKLGLPSIGGKDSMSGTFEDIDVPPTLVSFAVAMTKASKTISTEFKNAGSKVIFVPVPENKETLMPVWDKLIKMYNAVYALCEDGKVLSASVVKEGGTAASVCKACFGNGFGFKFANELTNDELFAPLSGSLVIELADGAELSNDVLHYDLGTVTNDAKITVNGKEIELSALLEKWTAPLEKVFPTKAEVPEIEVDVPLYSERNTSSPAIKTAKPTVFIPVFPGTNCEVDTARAFEKAGANVEMLIVKNLSSNDIEETIDEMEKLIAKSQMIMLPGGFSGGDEPDGSGKFIATTFRNPRIAKSESLKQMTRRSHSTQSADIFHIWLIQELLPLSHRGLQMSTQAMCLLFPCHTVRADLWLMLKLLKNLQITVRLQHSMLTLPATQAATLSLTSTVLFVQLRVSHHLTAEFSVKWDTARERAKTFIKMFRSQKTSRFLKAA